MDLCRGMYFQQAALFIMLFDFFTEVRGAIKCRQCENKFGTCDSGECVGESCVMMEVISNGGRSVTKRCSPEITTRNVCQTARLAADMEKRTCTCSGQFCNSEDELRKQNGARSQAAIDRNKRGNQDGRNNQTISTNYLVMLIFMCLFIVGSFSLLIFNTVCVHLC